MEFSNLQEMGRGRLDHSFEETPKQDDFEPLHRRSSIENQDDEDMFFTSPLTVNEHHVIHSRGGDQNTRGDQIFHDMSSNSVEQRMGPDFDSRANMGSFLKGTEYDIFGQVDEQHATSKTTSETHHIFGSN